MTSIILIFISSCVLSFAITFALVKLAPQLGVFDIPDERKLHSIPIPNLGGIPIFIGFFLPLLLLGYVYSDPNNSYHMMILNKSRDLNTLVIGALVILLTGVIDDIRPLKARHKLLGQLIAASIVYFMGFSIDNISIPIAGRIELGLLDFPLTIIWFIGCMNVVNLIDGLDGLAAGVCLLVGLIFLVVTLIFQQPLGTLYLATFCGAIFGFLWFNFFPARIFLGDSGSMLLGYLIAHLAILETVPKTETTLAILVALVALGLPIFDTLLAILRRWIKRMPLYNPDRLHIHHILLNMGYSHRRAVLTLYGACVFLGLAALLITLQRNEITALIFLILIGLAIVFTKLFSGLSLQDLASQLALRSSDRARERELRDRINSKINSLDASINLEDLTLRLKGCLEAMECQSANIQVNSGESELFSLHFEADGESERVHRRDSWSANLCISDTGRYEGSAHLTFTSEHALPSYGLHQLSILRQHFESALSKLLNQHTSANDHSEPADEA